MPPIRGRAADCNSARASSGANGPRSAVIEASNDRNPLRGNVA
jgi:hypothetical protein